jgi:hypothetical protein
MLWVYVTSAATLLVGSLRETMVRWVLLIVVAMMVCSFRMVKCVSGTRAFGKCGLGFEDCGAGVAVLLPASAS